MWKAKITSGSINIYVIFLTGNWKLTLSRYLAMNGASYGFDLNHCPQLQQAVAPLLVLYLRASVCDNMMLF